MNRIIAAVGLSALFATSAQAAVTIQTVYSPTGALPSYTTAQVFQSFNAASQTNGRKLDPQIGPNGNLSVAGYDQKTTGNVRTYQTNEAGEARGPTTAQGGNGAFLALLGNGNGNNNGNNQQNAGATYTIGFQTAVSLFSFVFGTLDEYNSVTLKFTDNSITTLTGGQIRTGLLSTSVGAFDETGGRVTYDFGLSGQLKEVTFRSTLNSFEIDQIAAAVPEPGTWAMMIIGFGFAGWQLRARRQPKIRFATT